MRNRPTLDAARATLFVVSTRTADLVATAPDTSLVIDGSSWTVREAAVHLAIVGFRYAGMVHGEPIQFSSLDPRDCLRRNDELNADVPERRPTRLADLIREGTTGLLTATASRTDTEDVVFDGGIVLQVGQLVGVAVAEHLLHGYEVAVALGRPWRTTPEQSAMGSSWACSRWATR